MLDTLLKSGWSQTQAQALAELIGDGKPWGEDGRGSAWRQRHLHDYCSAHGKQDPTSLEGQLAFLTYDMKVCMPKLYREMIDTNETKRTVEAVKEAAQPYFDKLREEKNGFASK